MIRDLRRKHVTYWLVLAPIILGVLVVALVNRAQIKTQLNASIPQPTTSSEITP